MPSDFVQGDKVSLLKIDDWFFAGIGPDDVSRLKTLIGLEWTVVGHSEHGHVELEFTHGPGSATPLEWVTVPPTWIERT